MDSRTRLFMRILRFPLVSLLLLYVSLQYVALSGNLFIQTFVEVPVLPLVAGGFIIANLLLVYLAFAAVVERRMVSELSLPSMGRDIAIGVGFGFGLFSICILIAMALGLYRIEGIDSWRNLLQVTGATFSTPFFEELAFRGVVFRIVEGVCGGWIALIVSSVIFGLVHLSNEGETIAGIAAIAIVYGPMLAAPYMLTRRLWMGIGLHAAWNYTMAKIFSGAVSGGSEIKGLLKTSLAGPELLTGGSAGMEGSLIAVVVTATFTVLVLILAVRRRRIVPPAWTRTIA